MKKLGLISMTLLLAISIIGCSASNNKVSKENIKPTVESQTISLTGVENARELGGYIGADGKKVKSKVLLRTGKLSGSTEEDIKRLQEVYNLKYVVDFRTTDEIEKGKDPQINGAINKQIRVLEEGAPTSQSAAMTNIYVDPVKSLIDMVSNGTLDENMYLKTSKTEISQKGFGEFFDLLLENKDGAILWHCTGGKDRAGVASALLLSALGVDRETILEDFDLTNQFYSKKIEERALAATKYTKDETIINGVKTLTGVDKNFMKIMLDGIDKEYGSVENYLDKKIGVSKSDIKKLQEIYLEA